MTNGKLIAFGVGGVILWSLLSKAKTLATLTFFPPIDIPSIKMEGYTPVLTTSLVVQNTGNQKLVLNSIAGNLYLNEAGKSTLVGNVGAFTPQTIEANSQTMVEVKIMLLLFGAVNDIIRIIQYGGAPKTLELDGMANVDRLQIPVKLKFTLD